MFCRGSADFLMAFKRDTDLSTRKTMARIPTSYIPHKNNPITEGISRLTDSAKSLIGFTVTEIFEVRESSAIDFPPDDTAFPHAPNQAKTCVNPIGRKGINGTARIPNRRNHKRNCIRLVK